MLDLYHKALGLLDKIGRPAQKAMDPNDPDARITSEGEPSDKKLEAAGEEAAAGGQAAGAEGGEGSEGGEEGGVPANPGPGAEGEDGGEGAESGEDHQEPDGDEGKGGEGDGDGDEDMSPDEVRELRKAFGLSDADDINDIAKGKEIAPLLKSILGYMQKVDAYQQHLSKELADLKAKHSSGKGDEALRVAMKAMDDRLKPIQDFIENIQRTAPAAAPRAVQKAVQTPAPSEKRLTIADVTRLALAGEITGAEAAKLTRMINHNQTPA